MIYCIILLFIAEVNGFDSRCTIDNAYRHIAFSNDEEWMYWVKFEFSSTIFWERILIYIFFMDTIVLLVRINPSLSNDLEPKMNANVSPLLWLSSRHCFHRIDLVGCCRNTLSYISLRLQLRTTWYFNLNGIFLIHSDHISFQILDILITQIDLIYNRSMM